MLAAGPLPVRGAEEDCDEGAQDKGDAAPLPDPPIHSVAEAGACARQYAKCFLCVFRDVVVYH